MKKRLFYLAALALLIPAPLRAQQSNPAGPPGGSSSGGGAAHDRRQLAEDIEIMRRLLGRALAGTRLPHCLSCHVGPVTFSPDGKTLATGPAGFRFTADKICEPGRLMLAALSPTSNLLATPNFSGTVRLWDPRTGKALNVPSGHAPGLSSLEGVYLKGYGVVYTVTMPPQPHATKTQTAKPAPKALNDWERVRKELRGDKVAEAAPALAAPPSLTDVILRVLMKNGRHFTSLGGKEKLTVVVTFRDPHTSAGQPMLSGAAMKGMQAGGMQGMSPGGVPMAGGMQGMNAGGPPGTSGGFSGTGRATGLFGQPGSNRPPQSARDHELVGDLHLKQGRTTDALQAYKNALGALGYEHGPAAEAHKRNLYRKMAQAYLGLADRSNPSSHEKMIAQAMKFLQAAQEPKGAEPVAASARLPAKLIITVSKSALEAAGTGGMSFEEFRRYASVESVPTAASEQPPADRRK
jgi:hypothetical protein